MHIFNRFSTPKVLLSDQGTYFKKQVLDAVCKQCEITQSFTVAYHPQSNGLVERNNRKILEILRHIVDDVKDAWEDWLPQVATSINGSLSTATGKSPYWIIFGKDKRLPYDLLTGPRKPEYHLMTMQQSKSIYLMACTRKCEFI